MHMKFSRLLTRILLCSLLGACAGTQPRSAVQEYLEEATGSTITHVTTPVVFVSKQPGLASSGRDYVYLAPIIVNSGGQHSCWLWLGVWSTIDRQARDTEASPLRLGTLQIVSDHEPMDLDSPAAGALPPGLRQIPYATPVPPIQELLIPVTCSQIRRLGSAQVLTLTDRPGSGAARVWQADTSAVAVLNRFSREAGAVRATAAAGSR